MVEVGPPIIKICGVMEVATARAAIQSGATAIGFMLADSRRQVSPECIAGMLAELPDQRPEAVGVTVNESAAVIARIVQTSGIDAVQLSGDESPGILDEMEIPVWKVFRFPAGTGADEAYSAVEPWLAHARPPRALLIDAAVPGRYGGTGHAADWDLAAKLAERYPVILAGGLSPANVAGAIGQVRPMGVDVSSGVEMDGRKHDQLIAAFIESSARAFERLP